jgi:putative endonuclease
MFDGRCSASETLARGLRVLLGTVTMERYELGIVGENLAVETLSARGYAILERRYRTEHGEIDIVAIDGDTLVFVEVRAKATVECGTAAESVTRNKQLQVVRMAVEYLARHEISGRPCRFDVVAIDDALSGEAEITVYPDAFDAL